MQFNEFYRSIINEEMFRLNNINPDTAYQLFSQEYLKATGKTWNKGKFLSRAADWTFYGTKEGFIAVRYQNSGYVKLVGVAGNNRGKYIGFKEVISKNLPLWGMVSKEMVPMAKKMGMIVPPAFLLRFMMKSMPSSVFSGTEFTVNNDGSVTLKYSDVGDATKFFIGTKQYFYKLIKDGLLKLPGQIKKFLGLSNEIR